MPQVEFITPEQDEALLDLRLAFINSKDDADSKATMVFALSILGERNFRMLMAHWDGMGREQFEREFKLPSRSSKAVLNSLAQCVVGIMRQKQKGK